MPSRSVNGRAPRAHVEPCPAASVRITMPSGARQVQAIDPLAQLVLWACVLFADQRGLVELAPGSRDADGRLRIYRSHNPRHYPDCRQPSVFALRALGLSLEGREVFAGPIARAVALPGRAGVTGGTVAWVDIDDPDALQRLDAFTPAPTLVVASGGSGGAHAYWGLRRRLPGQTLEILNLALAARLAADPAVRDRGRLLRLPGTRHGRTRNPCRLVSVDLRDVRHDPDDLADFSPLRPPRPTPPASGRGRPLPAPDGLDLIDPPAYFSALTGRDPGPGLIRCPLPDHEDRTPSCRVYATPERGWWCYGCGRGGGLYDLASLLDGGPWGRALRGEAFRRARLTASAALARTSARDGSPSGAASRTATRTGPRTTGGLVTRRR